MEGVGGGTVNIISSVKEVSVSGQYFMEKGRSFVSKAVYCVVVFQESILIPKEA